MPPEARARIKINKLLEEAGWRLIDGTQGKANVSLESHTNFNDLGDNFEKAGKGFVDYLLLDNKGFPLAVLEAKAEQKNPLDGKEQARDYATAKKCRFIILSNGNIHYLWDIELGNPEVITAFPSLESFGHSKEYKPEPEKLIHEVVEEDYVALTQNPLYKQDPRWKDESKRNEYINEAGLKFLRPYQIKAIQALQDAAKEGRKRYLFEMATGTGKTLTAAAIIKLFLKTGNANRVLFLVDRLELENQAYKNFKEILKNDYTSVIYKEKKSDWQQAEIVVSTVQSLSFNNKYKKLFAPNDFDFIISDEAHRSVGGNSRAVFEYFLGYKLGLTATPRNYLKNIDEKRMSIKDPRAWERRQLLDTYKTFGCDSAEPTFKYSLLDGVRDNFLINPIVVDARTDITTQLLSDEGYVVPPSIEDNTEEESYTHKDFEKKFFSDKTNTVFVDAFMRNALRDPISGEIGKGIIFCVSQNHASKITQILNEYAHKMFPGKYNSDFAIQVTSNIADAQQFTINFANNNLRGKTNWLEDYKSSKARICVTVNMMTTGYDCSDILNLCMMRPIFSPTDFIQIKGRGTRKHIFTHTTKDDGQKETFSAQKENFKLFDFFANCEYFEEKYDYEIPLTLPVTQKGKGAGPDLPPPPVDELTINDPDKIKEFKETAIGLEGMKIDRKLFESFANEVKLDKFVADNIDNIELIEEYIRSNKLDKPSEYYTLEKLRKALKIDRKLSLREILEHILGHLEKIKSKEELLDDEVDKFISIYKPDPQYVIPIRNYIKAYLVDKDIREIIDNAEYGSLVTTPLYEDFRALDKNLRVLIPEYIRDYVPFNIFE